MPKDNKATAKFEDNMATTTTTTNEIRDKFASIEEDMRFLEELVNFLMPTGFHGI